MFTLFLTACDTNDPQMVTDIFHAEDVERIQVMIGQEYSFPGWSQDRIDVVGRGATFSAGTELPMRLEVIKELESVQDFPLIVTGNDTDADQSDPTDTLGDVNRARIEMVGFDRYVDYDRFTVEDWSDEAYGEQYTGWR